MRDLRTIAALLALAAAPAFAAADAASADAAPQALPPAFDEVDDVPMPDPDLWSRIRFGFALEPLDSPLVAEQEDWYASRPDYIKRFVDRGSLYLHYIVEQVEKRHMPTEIALLPVIESAFTPKAASRAKASGLWQFIPSTGKNFGLKQTWWVDKRNDIMAATDAALSYLERLHEQFGSWELALAAYNCGEGCVSRAIAWNQKHGLPTDYLSLTRLPPETRAYVPKLMAVKNIVLSPATYGIAIQADGTIKFDSAKFQAALASDPAGTVAAVQTIASRVQAVSATASDPVTGTVTASISSQQTQITNDQSAVSNWTTMLAAKRKLLTAQYTALVTTLGQLQNEQNYLTQQINAMNPSSSN